MLLLPIGDLAGYVLLKDDTYEHHNNSVRLCQSLSSQVLVFALSLVLLVVYRVNYL